MLTITQLPLNATVSFDLYPSQVLGTGYKRAKILAILDAETAARWIDPIAMHANVYPTLPPGVPNRFDGYNYLKLKLASGEVTAIGIPWIKDETFVVASTSSMQLTIDSVSPADQQLILNALSANGFTAVNVVLLD